MPPILPTSRAGWFSMPPTGPGYYSLADQLQGEFREKPPKYPYPRSGVFMPAFFDIDWKYLDDPKNTEHDKLDFLKRQRFGDCDQFMFSTGGEFRARYNFEENSRLLNTGPRHNRGRDNSYDLHRLRVYGDLWYTDQVRVYGEVFSAVSPNWLLPPLVTDRDQLDLLNLFVEFNLGDVCCNPLWLRVGRQELLYGSQRLVSTLDWVNTRRTFQGAKLHWQSAEKKLWVDAFCVQPVVPNYVKFDSVDNNQVFAGLWTTYRPSKNQTIDVYYLFLDNANRLATGSGGVRGGTTVNTWGARCVGDHNNWLYDLECMVQYGGWANQTLFAKSYTLGGGYHFKESCWSPVVWLYYDHASGDDTPGEGNVNQTFNQLFPFGHYYFGFIDVVGRRNINDVQLHTTFYPNPWVTVIGQCHNFFLDSARDALYNAGGAAVRQDRTGRAGSYVGTELDLVFNFHLSNHSDLLLSYSYMFAGPFIRRTATTSSARDDPQALYVQYSYRW